MNVFETSNILVNKMNPFSLEAIANNCNCFIRSKVSATNLVFNFLRAYKNFKLYLEELRKSY